MNKKEKMKKRKFIESITAIGIVEKKTGSAAVDPDLHESKNVARKKFAVFVGGR